MNKLADKERERWEEVRKRKEEKRGNDGRKHLAKVLQKALLCVALYNARNLIAFCAMEVHDQFNENLMQKMLLKKNMLF